MHIWVYILICIHLYHLYPSRNTKAYGCQQIRFRTFVETPRLARGVKNCNGY